MAGVRTILHVRFACLLWIYVSFPLTSTAITLEVGPQNKTVVEGDRVSVICDLNNDNDKTIFWTYLNEPGRRRYISSNAYIYPFEGYGVDPINYEVIVDEAQQTYELVILSIVLSKEAGIYQCGYEDGSGRRFIPLASTMIIVSPISESLSCQLNLISSLGSELSQEYEVACSWTHSQPGEAHFDSSNGEMINVDLKFPRRIITRLASLNTPSIVCRFMLDNDASVTINAPCTGDNALGLIRVDPFINEVALGSSASFICTSGNQFYSPDISWDVISTNGSVPDVSQRRLVENEDVFSIINVQDGDQFMVVECEAHFSEDLVVSSYASLRITSPISAHGSSGLEINWITIHAIIIIFVFFLPVTLIGMCFLREKWEILCANPPEGNLSTVSQSAQNRISNRGKNLETTTTTTTTTHVIHEQPKETSSVFHAYSTKIYQSNIRPNCQEFNLESNYEIPTVEESLQIPPGLKQNPPHLEMQSLETSLHTYETIPDTKVSVIAQSCEEPYLEILEMNDPSELDNRYIQDLKPPILNLNQ